MGGAHPLIPSASDSIGMAVFLRRCTSRDNSATSCFSPNPPNDGLGDSP